jgi:O-acetyl-ADP-ribose deacetylase (regulator of RNase III)
MTRNQRGEAELPPGPARELVALLRLLHSRAPLTIGQISIKSDLTQGHISEVLRGWKAPSPNAAEAITRALGADDPTVLKARRLAEALAELNRHTRAKERASRPTGATDIAFDVPPPPRRFVGRAAEAEQIRAALHGAQTPHRASVAQIYGAAGIGKTALACIVAHEIRSRFPDGCLFIDVGALDEPSAVHARLLARLGVSAVDIPTDPAEARALYLSRLYRRSVLIVADDVADSTQAAALVPASSACAVIVTSRGHLDALDDGCAIRLGPLTEGESETLLAALLEQPDALSAAEISRITGVSGGVPRALRAASAQLRGSDLGPADHVVPQDLAESPNWTPRRHADAVMAMDSPTGPIPVNSASRYPLKPGAAAGDKSIGIISGDLRRVRNIDIWVNPENTDMKMSRFEDYTISAIIRYDGARQDPAGRVIEDTIADELERKVAGFCPVAAGTAVATGPGRLALTHNVRAVVHVAAVYGEPGAGYRQIRDVGRCVTSALAEADRTADHDREISVLFPLLGTGQGRGSIELTATVLVGAAVDYLASVPGTRVGAVWFLAHTYEELAAITAAVSGNQFIAVD